VSLDLPDAANEPRPTSMTQVGTIGGRAVDAVHTTTHLHLKSTRRGCRRRDYATNDETERYPWKDYHHPATDSLNKRRLESLGNLRLSAKKVFLPTTDPSSSLESGGHFVLPPVRRHRASLFEQCPSMCSCAERASNTTCWSKKR
jgi:hypothetical protein